MANGQATRQSRGLAKLSERPLDLAIFQRVKRDHRQTTTYGQRIEACLQTLIQLFSLCINVNANGLKCLGRRVFTLGF